MREGKFQTWFREQLEFHFPGSVVVKLDTRYKTGVPDLIMLWEDKWATFEVKADAKAAHRPLQDYYVQMMNDMSFSAFVHPENFEEVLDAVQRALQG